MLMAKKKGYIWQLPTSVDPGIIMQEDGSLIEFYTVLSDTEKNKNLQLMFKEMTLSRSIQYTIDTKGKATLHNYVK